MKKVKSLVLAVASLLFAGNAMAQSLAFPTAEGFGKYASGGRGGEVVEVTNLLDDPTSPPEGSFRWALKQHQGKPITVVFRVSGIIDLKGNDLRNKRNDVTIAGQTAPGDGICIKGGCVNLGGSRNVIIRHMRFRLGILGDDSTYCPGTVDKANFIAGSALNIENGGNFIIDHCSFSWTGEENMGFYDNDHTTVQWCITSEALYNCGHQKGQRSYGAVWGGKTATYHHNLLAHNYSRSPRFGSTTKNDKHMLLDVVNNVNYNWGKKNACYGGDNRQGDDGLFQLNFENNYYKPGPARDGTQSHLFVGASFCDPKQGSQGTSYGDWHLSGNYMEGSYAEKNGLNTDNYKGFDISAYQENVTGLTLADMKSEHIDCGEYAINMETAQEAYASVLKKSGAFPRDSHDTRIMNEVETGTAQYYGSCGSGKTLGIIDKPSDSGGYPTYNTYGEITDADHDGMDDAWETANGLDPTDASDRNLLLKGGYTALEAYLCSLVGETIALEKQDSTEIVEPKDSTETEDKKELTITVKTSPAEGGTVETVAHTSATDAAAPLTITTTKGETVALAAVASDGYEFKNWQSASGEVLSADAEYYFVAEESMTLTAIFALKAKDRVYRQPVTTDYAFELVDLTQIPEKVVNGATGAEEWALKHEYTDWVGYNASPVQVGGRSVELDPATGEHTAWTTYGTGNMIRVGQEKWLTLYLTNTSKIKVYFNGAASSAGHLELEVSGDGVETKNYATTLEVGKKTTVQSDTLTVDLDATKQLALTFKGTQDMALWALNLWPGTSTGISETMVGQAQDAEVYSLDGMRVSSQQPGNVYIVRKSDGHVVKVHAGR